MRHLFYTMVEMITERITGIENGSMTLFELPTYIETSREVIIVSNCICAVMLPICIIGFVVLVKFFNKMFDKIFSHSKKQELV